MTQHQPYDPTSLEAHWRTRWRQEAAFEPPPARPGVADTFIYSCTPFTTGKAHIGHIRSYSIADAFARYARSRGDAVLWAMGFDAFGLPNEIAAIEHAVAPRAWIDACKRNMIAQFDEIGLSVDWSRCFDTSEPEYYRWTQWVFLRFLEHGLVYRAEGIENWCSKCRCVLASLQVNDEGLCWRCGGPVTLSCIPQWYFRILPYADELERTLSNLGGWDEAVLACQRALFGKTEGVELDLALPSGRPLTVFLANPHGLSSVAFVAVSPNHPDIEQLVSRSRIAIDLDAQRRRNLDRGERSLQNLQVCDTGLTLELAGFDRRLPIVVTPMVDVRFGGGAVLGVPAYDSIDAAIASQLGLHAVPGPVGPTAHVLRAAVRYRLRDNSVSRQRFWGAPIPIIHCARCGQVQVPDKDLPVRLPDDIVPTGEGNALAAHSTFARCGCPRCGGEARRDTDTLDVHFDSIWMLVPFCVPAEARSIAMFTHPDLERWLPVAQVVCGADQAGWWMNDRLFFRVMRDSGYLTHLSDAEPVRNLLLHEMVLANGRKMSKSLGNAVDPDQIVRRYGADAVRLTVLKVNPRRSFSWSEEALKENHQFLSDLWDFVHALPRPAAAASTNLTRKLARSTAAAKRKVTVAFESQAFHLVEKESKLLFDAIRRASPLDEMKSDIAIFQATSLLLDFLEPLAPHIAAELKTVLAKKSTELSLSLPPANTGAPATASDPAELLHMARP